MLTEIMTVSGGSKFNPGISSVDATFTLEEAAKRYADLHGLAAEIGEHLSGQDLEKELDEIQRLAQESIRRCGTFLGASSVDRKNILTEQMWDEQILLDSAGKVADRYAAYVKAR